MDSEQDYYLCILEELDNYHGEVSDWEADFLSLLLLSLSNIELNMETMLYISHLKEKKSLIE